jgi:hypothetical protein
MVGMTARYTVVAMALAPLTAGPGTCFSPVLFEYLSPYHPALSVKTIHQG